MPQRFKEAMTENGKGLVERHRKNHFSCWAELEIRLQGLNVRIGDEEISTFKFGSEMQLRQ